MTKKGYTKPALTIVTVQQAQMLCNVSRVGTTGLDVDLNYNKGTGNMSGAMVKRDRHSYNVWDEDWQQ